MTPSFFPIAISVVTLVVLACVIYRAIRSKPGEVADGKDKTEPAKSHLGAALILVATGLYIAAFPRIGYFISTTIYVFLLTLIFGGREQHDKIKRLLFRAIVSIVIAVGGYLLFDGIFQVRLPVLWQL